jgi:gliding motility-associated-like protein
VRIRATYSISNSISYGKFFYSILFLILSFFSSYAQECGTVEYNQDLRLKGVVQQSDEQFELWMKQQLNNTRQQDLIGRKRSEPYRIQVVVHIIHNGEAVGSGTNIPSAQVLSQIEVLNKDFKRLNNDAGNTPAEFLPVATSMNIEFVLATTGPTGTPTSGINRVQGTQTAWAREDDVALKSLSYWPAENYLNIWVCNLTGFRGYAQFPLSTLPGLEITPTNRLTDGVVIGHRYFGSSDYGSFSLVPAFNKGRTATHELGHFLGLRHIWGDETDCNGTDYVDDTPPQAANTSGCPTHPQKSCPKDNPMNEMFQNYMDLTNDNCLNLFTEGQVSRMQIVLESSPRRASLLIPLNPDPPDYEFEKIFSPNGDGINDYWRWTNTLKYEGCMLTIYNRFGKPVYEKISYDNSWDGRSADGYVLEAGAYYYVIKCDDAADIKGGVRIVR